MAGRIWVPRDLWDDPLFRHDKVDERGAYLWLLKEASWKARTVRCGQVEVSLNRGQLAASVRFMAEAWKWEKSTVDRFLKRLVKRDMIGTASGTGVTVITICKYDEYQGGEKPSGTAKKEKAGQHRDSNGTNEKKGETREYTEEDTASYEAVVIRPVDEVSEAVAAYNDTASRAGWPAIQKLTDQRRRALRGRLSDCGGIEGWRCALGKAESSDFLCARTAKP